MEKFFTIIVLLWQMCNLEAEAHIMDKNTKVWVLCENSFFSNYMGFRLNYPPVRNGVPPTPRAKSGLICVFHAVQITTTTTGDLRRFPVQARLGQSTFCCGTSGSAFENSYDFSAYTNLIDIKLRI